jgi:hypothetical protein
MMGRKSLADSSSRADFHIDLTAAWTVSCMVPKGLYQFNSESLMKPTSYAMAHKSQETYYEYRVLTYCLVKKDTIAVHLM